MSAPTVKEQRERLEGILAASTLATTLLVADDQSVPADALPAYAVASRTGVQSAASTDHRSGTRNFEILLLLNRLPAHPTREDRRNALYAVEEVITTLPDYLISITPRLNLNGKPMNGVIGIGDISDDGAAIIEWGDTAYGGVVYTVPVITVRIKKGL